MYIPDTVIIVIERYVQSSGRNSIFGIFVNPIMQSNSTNHFRVNPI